MMRIALMFTLLLTACGGERIEPAPQPGDVHQLPPMEWRIVGQREMERIYRDAGMPLHDSDRLHGFIGQQAGRTVIYTTAPQYVDDSVTCTLGHEVMHAALGRYHK
ncbi:hypothetical protein CO615_02310 [Lysobacteraceae bacterium NML75-0749]|nr:hypothetical protein CO615_02310 [Xanthomonadaceae bacterium NML75-0749]